MILPAQMFVDDVKIATTETEIGLAQDPCQKNEDVGEILHPALPKGEEALQGHEEIITVHPEGPDLMKMLAEKNASRDHVVDLIVKNG